MSGWWLVVFYVGVALGAGVLVVYGETRGKG